MNELKREGESERKTLVLQSSPKMDRIVPKSPIYNLLRLSLRLVSPTIHVSRSLLPICGIDCSNLISLLYFIIRMKNRELDA